MFCLVCFLSALFVFYQSVSPCFLLVRRPDSGRDRLPAVVTTRAPGICGPGGPFSIPQNLNFELPASSSSSSLLISSLELSDTKVYEHQIRALLGTAAYFCKVVEFRATCLRRWVAKSYTGMSTASPLLNKSKCSACQKSSLKSGFVIPMCSACQNFRLKAVS